MGEHLDHTSHEHNDIFLRERRSAFAEIRLQVSNALLHLDVPLLDIIEGALGLLQDVTTAVLDNIGVRIGPNLGKQLYFEVPKLASEVGAELYGIESKGASLEELFRRAVSSDSS